MVEIAGIIKFTLIDYPGHVACAIFFQGCNFRCKYCQNYELIERKKGGIPPEYILEFLEERKDILNAVVLSGGEPLLQEDLQEFVKELKSIGFKVKLDTNGYLYDKLLEVIKYVDYVAMDVKAKKERYEFVTGVKINFKNILKSIDIIKNNARDYEFRTTVVPGLVEGEDIEEIAKILGNVKRYVIQNFNNKKTLDKSLSKYRPFSLNTLVMFKNIAKKYIKNVCIRNV